MRHALNATFQDASQAHRAISQILDRGGRDVDISAMFQEAYLPEPVAASFSYPTWTSRISPKVNLGIPGLHGTLGFFQRAQSFVPAALALGGLLKSFWTRREAAAKAEPGESYVDGSAQLAILCPSGSLSEDEVAEILRQHGAISA